MTSTIADSIRVVGYQARTFDRATVIGEIEGARAEGVGALGDRDLGRSARVRAGLRRMRRWWVEAWWGTLREREAACAPSAM